MRMEATVCVLTLSFHQVGQRFWLQTRSTREPSAADHYQMCAYLRASRVDVGILLAPAFNSDQVGSKRFVTTDGKVVWEISLPLSNLPVTEGFLENLVRWTSH